MAKRAWKYWQPVFQADEVCEMNPVWPWGGHRRFAYDLVRWMRPARIAELGVHWGTSFFAFAQAMKDGRMKETELVGVDTFEGEDHAGHYGPEILETVQRIVREHFPAQKITLHTMLFRDALPHVADESVDLLHIDGLHTYDAVKDDFETWLPKLAPQGIVLFHDVAPDTGYGSTDFWQELSPQHPSFAFEHSWGLGVLFPKGDTRFADLRKLGLEDKLLLYTSLARSERAAREVRDLTRMAEDRAEAIRRQTEMIRQRDDSLEKTRDSLADTRSRIDAAEKLARERFEIIQRQTEMVRTREETIERLQTQLENARKAAVHAARIERKLAAAVAVRDELRQRIEDFRERARAQEERLTEAREGRKALGERLEALREQNAKAREALAAMEPLRREAAAARAAQVALEQKLGDIAAHMAALVASHDRAREGTAQEIEKLARAFDESRRATEASVAAVGQRLRRLDTDAELLGVRAEYLEEIVGRQREQLESLDPAPPAEHDWLNGETRPRPAPPAKTTKPPAGARSPRKR